MFGVQAIVADVEYVTNTGTFSADQAIIRAEAEKTYGSISTESLKAAAIQERYNRVLAGNAIESTKVRDATIRYRTEMSALGGTTSRTSGALQQEEHSFGRVAKGALAGSGALGGLRRAAVFASSAFLGGFGLAYALKTVVNAAEEEQVALERLKTSLHNAGLSWQQYGNEIEDAVAKQSRGSGFTHVDISGALTANINRFHDVAKAISETALAEDVARQKGLSLADAQKLLQNVSFGNARSARQLGIEFVASTAHLQALRDTTKHATADQIAHAKALDREANATALYNLALSHFGGDAARYMKTAAGAQAGFTAALQLTEATIGTALLPTFTKYLGSLADWLGKAKNQARIQHDVNTAVHDGAIALHTIETILGPVAADFRTLGKVTGGTKHEIELLSAALFLLWTRSKLIKWDVISGGIGSVGSSATTAEGEVGLLSKSLLALEGIGAIVIPIILAPKVENLGEKASSAVGKALTGDGSKGWLSRAVGIPTPGEGGQASDKEKQLFAQGEATGKYQPGTRFADEGNGQVLVFAPSGAKLGTVSTAGKGGQVAQIFAKYGLKAGEKTDPKTEAALELDLLKSGYTLRRNYPTTTRTATTKPPAKPGADTGGKGSGSGYKVTGVALLNQNLDEAQASGNEAAIKAAAEAKLEYDIKAAAFAKQRLASGKGSPELYQQYQQVLADESSQRSTIASATNSGTSTANKAQSAHARAIATRRRTLENKVAQAELVAGKAPKTSARAKAGTPGLPPPLPASVTKAFDKVIAFDRAEAHDKGLTAPERASYESAALAEVKKKRAAVKTRDTQIGAARKREISALTQIPDNLKAAVLLAKNEEQEAAALRRELAAVNAQIETLKKIGAGKAAVEKARLVAAGIQHRINALAKKGYGKSGESDLQKNEGQFLSEFASIVKSYAPNAFPDGQPAGKGSKLNPNEYGPGVGSRKSETHLYEAVHELRGIKAHLSTVVQRTKFPHSEYALSSADGVTG